MASIRKIMDLVCSGRSDTNVRFLDLRRLLTGLGFTERVKGSHHIYSHEAIPEILNLQPVGGGKAKPYQVKQVRQVVLKYGMSITER